MGTSAAEHWTTEWACGCHINHGKGCFHTIALIKFEFGRSLRVPSDKRTPTVLDPCLHELLKHAIISHRKD